jgi:anaerobic ribonucleoside-triphosphate reductase activating protein
MNWRLNKIQYPVYNLGEGKRVGFWVQGCSLGCKGCINQTIWKKGGGKEVPIPHLFNWLLSISSGYEGITVSGGEPFEQYIELIAFLHLIKTRTKLNVHCFTGYRLEELYGLYPDRLFLRYIDTLVDGRYIQEEHENSNIKGSRNQNVYRITNCKPDLDSTEVGSKLWSLKIDDDNTIYMAGIPRYRELEELCKELETAGIRKEFR